MAAVSRQSTHLTCQPPHAGHTPPDALCYATLSFLHIFMLLPVPLLMAARHHHRHHCQEAQQADQAPQPQPPAGAPGRWARVQARLSRSAAAADRSLAALLAPRHPAKQLFVWWWLTAYSWQLAKGMLAMHGGYT